MKSTTKLFTLFSLLILASLVFVPAAQAFDGRSDDRIVIGKDEVINDDLYLAGNDIIIDGTVNGDLMAAGNTVVVNGSVTGDLWAAGSSVTVNGQVGDDLFAAGAAVTLGPDARIADDVFSAAASVETQPGSTIGGQLMIGAFQGLVAGDVMEDLRVGSNRLRLEGTVGGDAWVAVNAADQDYTPMPMWLGPDAPPMPSVPAGLTFGDEASIAGKLTYTSPAQVAIPSSVASQVEHLLPPADEQVAREVRSENSLGSWFLDSLRRLIALLVIGLLLARFLPTWILKPAEVLRERPWPSLGAGFLTLVIVPFALLVALGVVLIAAVVVGLLTLGGLVGAILGLGLSGLAFATVLFTLLLGYLPQLIVAYLVGRWILQWARAASAERIYWPLVLGVFILAVLFAIPFLGGLVEFIVLLFGLGAVALTVLRRSPQPEAVIAEA
ncbi:MAG: hypothetical protein A2Z16_07060 [Chloroflexi bacterium RBG_16_54_18]|nr:MAG: hypothetical protein A2Z16_07060 [Chloroflexi bacterium RBG_16_54_18]